jgi:folate-dependent phosphoribosylglycinamide formyltransferase PurN
MNIVLMTGTHTRHLFLARAVARSGLLGGIIFEERESHVPEPPAGLPDATRTLFVKHFADRAEAEARMLGADEATVNAALRGVEIARVSTEELNGPKSWSLLDRLRPDLLLSYGVHKLSPETLARVDGKCWNVHGGLSPWYRGVATHFWPSYMLEPQMTGMTVHETTEAIDGGGIVHQSVADLVRGDGIHDLACRAVVALATDLPELIARTNAGRLEPPRPQKTSGRIWRNSDWRPAHLHLVYDYYQNRIVDRALDGEFGGEFGGGSAAPVIRQF